MIPTMQLFLVSINAPLRQARVVASFSRDPRLVLINAPPRQARVVAISRSKRWVNLSALSLGLWGRTRSLIKPVASAIPLSLEWATRDICELVAEFCKDLVVSREQGR